MIRLDLTNAPKTVDLGQGVTVTHLPLNAIVWESALADPAVEAMVLSGARAGVTGTVMSMAVARRVITAWDGIGDAEGNPIPPSPAAIDLMMGVYGLGDTFTNKVVNPWLQTSAEGNAFAPLPTGNSKGATNTAKTAKKPAKSARSGSMTRRPSKASRSGVSSSA